MVEENNMIRRDKNVWNPFGILKSLEDELDTFRRGFEDIFSFPGGVPAGMHFRTPLLDVKDDGEKYIALAELPGIKKENLNITLKDNILEISGKEELDREENDKGYILKERKVSEFRRAVRIPEEIDAKKIQATMENGILKITLPKSEERKSKEHRIKVQ